MINFIMRESDLPKVIPLLLSSVCGFKQSPEYLETGTQSNELPGVVCGLFANYLARLYATKESEEDAETIRSAHAVIEALSTSPESALEELVTDEIFENMDLTPAARQRFAAHLGPRARSLYERCARERGY